MGDSPSPTDQANLSIVRPRESSLESYTIDHRTRTDAVVTVVAKPEEETSSETSRRGSYGKSKVNSLFSKAPTPPEFENLVGT